MGENEEGVRTLIAWPKNGLECRIRFDGVGGGLVAKGSALMGFELSADGKAFVAAAAEIKGDTVIVTSADVKAPAEVRYAWAGWPRATLFNKEDLPATPFRWPMPGEEQRVK
ncbi:MAG: hypothetical protein FJ280_29375 [Planctomycetes bacterium]|nr:hypothetical protein [Planctomycetota bacterium]MBM4029476.1 hypothetical protein [Planctomycetota bacterium]